MVSPSLVALLALTAPALVEPGSLVTTAERSGFLRTGRYDEVVRLCEAFAAIHPARARCVSFGTSPQGRALKALVLSEDGVLTPEAARARGRPVVYVQGGIHAGEIDGKDAGFLVVRELLEGKAARGALTAVTLVFVPVLNVDGHERFGKNNRPNQRGPAEMGWRTTAQNLNLNRDFAKADAPETQALLRLLSSWDPVVGVDLHVTDGAKFQHDVAIIVEPAEGGPEPLRSVARALRGAVVERINARGHRGLEFYPELEVEDVPSSGFAVGVPPPRFFHGYTAMRNRIGVLVETHAWKDYRTRVRATRAVLVALLELATAEVSAWREAARALDALTVAQDPSARDVVLAWGNGDDKATLDFAGYAWQRVPSPVSGALRTIYDETKPLLWRVPLVTSVKPLATARAPGAGYVVAAGWVEDVKARLDAHGIRSTPVATSAVQDVESLRATRVTFGARPYEGRMTAQVEGDWIRERRAVEPGALFVPVAQPLGRLVVHLFEPAAPDSFASWGFFNAAFEQKEYMEAYVAEEVAEAMLEEPQVRAEFTALLERDPAFASSPAQRLEWFYRRHPSWDERKDLLPVLRVDVAPAAADVAPPAAARP